MSDALILIKPSGQEKWAERETVVFNKRGMDHTQVMFGAYVLLNLFHTPFGGHTISFHHPITDESIELHADGGLTDYFDQETPEGTLRLFHKTKDGGLR